MVYQPKTLTLGDPHSTHYSSPKLGYRDHKVDVKDLWTITLSLTPAEFTFLVSGSEVSVILYMCIYSFQGHDPGKLTPVTVTL